MKDVLKVYNVKLVVDGPVFIGNGREIGKKEYALVKNKKQIGVMEQGKLFLLLKEKRLLSEYSKFMMGNSRDDVGAWLEKQHVGENEYRQCYRYFLDCRDAVIESRSKLSVMEFMKDAYGLPYVPGSSIKGMLRTILLAYDLKNHSKKYQEDKKAITAEVRGRINKNTYLKKEITSIESACFRTLNREDTRRNDAVNDILSGMMVSDSQPLEIEDLILCQRIERHVNEQERKLNVLRETLRPGTEIQFQITIDTSICDITKEYLYDAVEYFGKMYYEYFLRKYSIFGLPDKNAVWLGGGVGFLSKTEVYPLFEEEGIDVTTKIFKAIGVPREHNHHLDYRWNVSPHICKIAYYQKQRYQMGLCHIVMEE